MTASADFTVNICSGIVSAPATDQTHSLVVRNRLAVNRQWPQRVLAPYLFFSLKCPDLIPLSADFGENY